MRYLTLVACLTIYSLHSFGQHTTRMLAFNHAYMVLDKETYTSLVSHAFIRDTLFASSVDTTRTKEETWIGLYLLGKQEYLELLPPDGIEHGEKGSMGLGFLLSKQSFAREFIARWQSMTSDSIISYAFTSKANGDTIIAEMANYRDSMLTGGRTCIFGHYYPDGLLKRSGFTDAQLANGISQEILSNTWYSSMFNGKLIDRVEGLEIVLNKQEWARHRIALQAMYFKPLPNQPMVWKSGDFVISVKLEDKAVHRIRKISFSLKKNVKPRKIAISKSMTIDLADKIGIIQFTD